MHIERFWGCIVCKYGHLCKDRDMAYQKGYLQRSTSVSEMHFAGPRAQSSRIVDVVNVFGLVSLDPALLRLVLTSVSDVLTALSVDLSNSIKDGMSTLKSFTAILKVRRIYQMMPGFNAEEL